jgi:hypothetical protein
MTPISNPYAVLVNVIAPAMLTNASSLLTMSTSNRLARAVDRARELAPKVRANTSPDVLESSDMQQLNAAEDRTHILVRALRWFYIAICGFAASTFLSVLGQLAAVYGFRITTHVVEVVGVVAGFVGVIGMVSGSAYLVHETTIAVGSLELEAANLRTELKARRAPDPKSRD